MSGNVGQGRMLEKRMRLTRARSLFVLGTALFSSPLAAEILGRDVARAQLADYPPEAIARHAEGETVVGLAYDRNAVVTKCTVVGSSGDSSLDEASCRLVTGSRIGNAQHAGTPIGSLTLYWKMQATPPSGASFGGATPIGQNWWLTSEDYFSVPAVVAGARGPVVVHFTVSADGLARDCHGEAISGAALAAQTCQLVEERASFITPHDATGPKSTTARQTLIWGP